MVNTTSGNGGFYPLANSAVYATTKEFLDYFGLKSLAELPSLAELKGHTAAVTSAAFSTDGTRIVTASQDVPATGPNAPGIKVIHLRGRSFVNPMPADYPLRVDHVANDGKVLAAWQGQLKVLDDAPPARLAPPSSPPG